MKVRLTLGLLTMALAACVGGAPGTSNEGYREVNATTVMDSPVIDPRSVAPANRAAVQRGQYMVELLGCGTCHTNGALIGDPDFDNALGGSDVGIAFESPMLSNYPGVVFPPNISSDIRTGIGGWSDEQLTAAIRLGTGRHGLQSNVVMPWPGYARLTDEDTTAIIRYLKNTKPIHHVVPDKVRAGQRTDEQFVYFGFYLQD